MITKAKSSARKSELLATKAAYSATDLCLFIII